MDLTFYHADATGREYGIITDIIKADIEIQCKPGASTVDNSFSLTMTERAWAACPVLIGHRIYAGAGEWGGIVTLVTHSTADAAVTIQGPTWRGLLSTRYIIGTNGAFVSVVNVDAEQAVSTAINGAFGDLVSVSATPAGVTVSAEWNCVSISEALNTTLAAYACRLNVNWSPVASRVTIAAQPARDWSNAVEISQDYGIHFTSTQGRLDAANHCIAISGDTTGARTVLNIYRTYDGEYTTTKPAAWDDASTRSVIVDNYSNEETAVLLEAGVAALEERKPAQGITVDQIQLGAGIEPDLGDYIGVRDRLTGLVATPRVVKKILTINGAETTLKIEVE